MSAVELGYKADTIIPFHSILYCKNMVTKFPAEHVLNFKGPDSTKVVLIDILRQDVGCSNENVSVQLLLQQKELTKSLESLIAGWKPCLVKQMFDQCCKGSNEGAVVPLQVLQYSNEKCAFSAGDVVEALVASIPPIKSKVLEHEEQLISDEIFAYDIKSVFPTIPENAQEGVKNPTLIPMKPPIKIESLVRFIHNFVRKFVPTSLFGSTCNRRNFCNSMENLLKCGCKDEFYLGNIMSNLRMNDFKWAKCFSNTKDQNYLVAKMLTWITEEMVLLAIRTFFYATESAAFGNLVLYYPKNVWHQLKDLVLNQLQKVGSLSLLRPLEESRNLVRKGILKKYPRIRLIPKLNGIRPICPMKSCAENRLERKKMELLVYSVAKRLGARSFRDKRMNSVADVWSKYLQWLSEINAHCAPLFVVKLDISDAYGSVSHSVLLQILKNFVSLMPSVIRYVVFNETNTPKGPFHYVLEDFTGNPLESAEVQQHWIRCPDPIVVNVQETVESIVKYIKNQYVSGGRRRKYLITKGIAQGGFLSSALCEMYYSSMYSTHWQHLTGQYDVCMRSVDDFLFVSAEKKSAERFLSVTSKGVKEYNCYVNSEKTLQNISTNGSPIRVPFCGIILCTDNRQFFVSVSSLSPVPQRYTLKISHKNEPVKFAASRLRQITNTRLRDEVSHPKYTSPEVLIANIYRTGMSAGARLEAVCKFIPKINSDIKIAKSIGSQLVSIINKVWKRIKTLWIKNDRAPSLPEALIVATYLGGVGSMLGFPHHLQLTKLQGSIFRLWRSFISRIPESHRDLLPAGRFSKRLLASARWRNAASP